MSVTVTATALGVSWALVNHIALDGKGVGFEVSHEPVEGDLGVVEQVSPVGMGADAGGE